MASVIASSLPDQPPIEMTGRPDSRMIEDAVWSVATATSQVAPSWFFSRKVIIADDTSAPPPPAVPDPAEPDSAAPEAAGFPLVEPSAFDGGPPVTAPSPEPPVASAEFQAYRTVAGARIAHRAGRARRGSSGVGEKAPGAGGESRVGRRGRVVAGAVLPGVGDP
ncbi:hypothetical protein ABT330_12490 [Streptomyces sp. NPDC000658]|uniref:hypothetical protein n=1 Tax=Streptomyces sp. NPDC000658 TaxID=3154266 RepID=UPI0033314364